MSHEHDKYEEHRARRADGRTVAEWLHALVQAGVVEEHSVTMRMDLPDHEVVKFVSKYVCGSQSQGVQARLTKAGQPFADGEPGPVADIVEASIGRQTGEPYPEHIRGVLVGCRQAWPVLVAGAEH